MDLRTARMSGHSIITPRHFNALTENGTAMFHLCAAMRRRKETTASTFVLCAFLKDLKFLEFRFEEKSA